jgi:hypothetical protein
VYTYPLEGDMSDYEFIYNDNMSYDDNFNKWYYMNCAEKSDFNEKPYNEKEGRLVFDRMYKKKRRRYGG